jgi:hypothetical protein
MLSPKQLEKTMSRCVADRYWTRNGENQVDLGPTFDAENDTDAWWKAKEWSASAAGERFHVTYLRLRRDGRVVKERPLAGFL